MKNIIIGSIFLLPFVCFSQVLIEIKTTSIVGAPYGIRTIGNDIYPDFIDLDGDQDLDLVFGNDLGDIYRSYNIGTSTNPEFDEPVQFLNTGGITHAKPKFIDIDNDGDLDVFIGSNDGKIHHYERISFGYAYKGFNLFNMNPGSGHCSLAFGDIDLDGDYDLFIGTDSTLFYARNLGTERIPSFGPVQENPFGFDRSFFNIERLTVEIADFNVDGMLDLLVGFMNGGMYIYYNQGSISFPDFDSLFIPRITAGGNQSAPAVGDWDNDGDLDLLVARSGALENVHIYLSSHADPSYELNEDYPFFGDSIWGENVSVDLGDYNRDGDLDLLVGNAAGEINIAQNNGILTDFQFDSMQVLPFGLSAASGQSTPVWHDLNRNSRLDIYAGSTLGDMWSYENIGSLNNPAFILRGINTSNYNPQKNLSAPSLDDLDGSPENLYVGASDGNIYFFKNTGTQLDISWELLGTNLFGLDDVVFSAAPEVVDIDGDSDRDLLVGAFDGNIHFFENIGSQFDPDFNTPIINPFGIQDVGLLSKPAIGDIDRDGDYDLLIGNAEGTISFFENRPCLEMLKLNHIDRNQHLYQSDNLIITKALFRTGTNNSIRALSAVECEFGFEVSDGAELQVDMGSCINN